MEWTMSAATKVGCGWTSSSPQVACVFDFDCTLSSRHVFYFINSQKHYISHFLVPHLVGSTVPDPAYLITILQISQKLKNNLPLSEEEKSIFINETFHSPERVHELRGFLSTLKNEKGFQMIIASRGVKSQILNCLKIIGLDDIFSPDQVYDRSTHKTQLLHDLIYKQNKHVLYFDDTRSEHDHLLQVSESRLKLEGGGDEDFDVFRSKNILGKNRHYIFCKSLPPDGEGIQRYLMEKTLRTIDSNVWFR